MTTLKFRTLADESLRRITMMAYGVPKVGKTSLVRTVAPLLPRLADGTPDWSRVCYIIADPGHASIADLTEIRYLQVPQDGTPDDVLTYLQSPGTLDNIDFVFIDGYDAIAQTIFDELEQKEIARAAKMRQNPDTRGVWGDFGRAARKWTLGMRDLPHASVIFLTHAQEREDGDVQVRPAFPGGKVRDELVGYFDFVLYQTVVPHKDPLVKDRAYPAIWITSRNTADGGNPRYEIGTRIRGDVPKLPARMPADISLLWATRFPDKEKK